MQGLRLLYQHRGRRVEWKSLVDEIVPDFVDPATDGPRPGRESAWSLVTQYRVHLAREAREWANAERLQRVCVEWDRQSAEHFVDTYQGRTDPPIVSDEAQPPGSERPPTLRSNGRPSGTASRRSCQACPYRPKSHPLPGGLAARTGRNPAQRGEPAVSPLTRNRSTWPRRWVTVPVLQFVPSTWARPQGHPRHPRPGPGRTLVSRQPGTL